MIIGYLVGTLSPSALIGKIKNDDLRTRGTGNLGATNVTMIYGRLLGILVMIFDIGKSFAVFQLSELIVPNTAYGGMPVAGLLSGSCAVIGHVFPFYMKFKGGKGVASLSGLIIAYDWQLFILLLGIGVILALIFNYGFLLPCSGAVLFSLITTLNTHSLSSFIITATIALLVLIKHLPNIKKIGNENEIRAREFVIKHLLRK